MLLQRTIESQVSRGTNFRIQDTIRLNCFRFVSALLLRYIFDACVYLCISENATDRKHVDNCCQQHVDKR